MCLIFLAIRKHPDYKFILAGNRDEFYKRKTAPAAFWNDHPQVVAGRDLEGGGTWLGMNASGRIAMVTNYRDPANIDPHAPSRGFLVSDFLTNNEKPDDYLARVEANAQRYNGFNLLIGTPDKLYYLSNYRRGISHLQEGIFGLSNHLLDTPWPKVTRGKEAFSKIIAGPFVPDALFEFLRNEERAADSDLPETGVGLERERALSAMFIKSPGYGSRCSTVILIDNDNRVQFAERVYDTQTFEFTTQAFSFQISES